MQFELLAPLGLNAMQYAILNNIGKRGSVATMELAALLSLERTTLYRTLTVLERRSLVETVPGRGREQILSLTAAGQELCQTAAGIWADVQADFVRQFGEDWDFFLSQLRRARAVAEASRPG